MEQPTEYGKALIEAVALGMARTCGYSDDEIAAIKREPATSSATHWYGFQEQARAALLAACAKLKEPPEKTLDEMDVVYCEAGIEAALSWFFSQLITEIGT